MNTSQTVNIGVTHSGRVGLFTGGMLAWPLTRAEYDKFTANPATLVMYCARLGFVVR